MHEMFNPTRNQSDHTCRKRTCLLPVMDHVNLPCKSWGCSEKTRFLIVQSGITQVEMDDQRYRKDSRGGETLKRLTTIRPSVALYLDELPS